MVGVALLGGAVATAFALAVAYYATASAVGLRVDPDTYGIPMVTSSVDFAGVVALVVAAAAFGVVVV
jgi:mgtE-like transporter